MKQATTSGVAQDTNAAILSEDDAASAFLSKWSDEDGESLSETQEENEEELTDEEGSDESTEAEDGEGSENDHQEESDDETSEDDSDAESDDEGEDESEESDEDTEEDKPKSKVLADDAVVKVKVNGEELDVSVKDLKRLYGQEKALTQKTQEVANKRKEADGTAQRLNASYQKLYDKALERFKPYAEIDMLVASKTLDAEQFAALRKEAQAAYEDFKFIAEEADAFVKQNQAEAQTQLKAAAKECLKVLKADIPDWSPKLYDQIREYAIGKGIDADRINNLVDPVLIKMFHQARLYEESKKIATKKKVAAAPKKVLKATTSTSSKDIKGSGAGKAKQKYMNTGSVDDAADLFMARWASEGDE